MPARLILLLALLAVCPFAKGDEEPDYAAELPRIPPTEAKEALATFVVHPGFHLELAAAEPHVASPVAASFDERGRLYVVEMRDYSEQDKEFLGTVRLLEDADQDGRFEKSTVFADKLSWPTAIICYDGGVFVGAAPDIYYLKDTDGDGKTDVRRTVFTGFARTNVQGLINSFQWGLDNRIHGATSSSGAEVRRPDRPKDAPLVLRGRDFAFDPRTLVMEATSGGAQHGMSFDNWGRKFLCSNSDHIQLVMFEDRYIARNPLLAAPSPRLSIAVDGPQAEVFRISPVEPWRIVRTRLRVSGAVKGPIEGGGRAAGYFTGATGTTIYRGNAFPPEYIGQAFVGDVGSNIVHRKVLEPDGVGLKARRADEGREFVASKDIWFRPAQFANAPDGTLYILDVYREVIEHPNSLPPMIKKHLDLTSGRDRGRIYRLVPDSFKQLPLPRLDQASTPELVATLEHRNGWHRDTAARLLFERQDKAAIELLERQATSSRSPEGRMHSLYALQGLGGLSDGAIIKALADSNPRVREHAVRLAEGLIAKSKGVRSKLVNMTDEPDLRVRYQLAFTLGQMKGEGRDPALAAMARRDGGDRWMRLAIQSSLADGAAEITTLLLADAESRGSAGARNMLEALVGQVGSRNKDAELKALLAKLVALQKTDPVLLQQLVRALSEGLAQRGRSFREVAATSPAAGLLDQLLAEAGQTAIDAKHPLAARTDAIRTLALGSLQNVQPLLANLLGSRQPQEVQLAALATLGRFKEPQVAQAALNAWSGFSPRVRAEATELLFARPERLGLLLDAIEKGTVSPTEIDPARIKQLTAHPKLGERATKAFANVQLARRGDVVEAYRSALAMSGDRERGREVFKKVCAACHKLDGIGHEVGPNLAAMQNRGPEAILVNVLDPNREVNPQFVNYLLLTDDGRSLTGMIAAETATSVTLKRAEAQTDTVLRVNIEELASTRLSIMPEGVEKQIDVAAMSDLLAFVAGATAQGNAPANNATWKAGAAKVVITPKENMWMSGYGGRDKPSEGKVSDLWAKALVIEDSRGERVVLVTMDLVGIDRETSLAVRAEIARNHQLKLPQIVLNCSHTHCGPVVGRNLSAMYFLDAAQQKLVDDYTERLKLDLVAVADEAIKNLSPASLSWANGRATFAVNRRNNKEAEVPMIRSTGGELKGPVDHDVPVLKVAGADGKLKAVAFGYACHATVLSFFQWCADYPGFAQTQLEQAHPGAVALFWAGCGADQNPLPRRSVELAQQYGGQLATAVEEVLKGSMKPIMSELNATYREIDLALDKLPTREQLVQDATTGNKFEAQRARTLLANLQAGKPLSQTYPYPIQTWRLGSDLCWITLGGEVVVDYSLRIKQELGRETTWVAGYSNDVMAYIPSLRVLKEGGYEGGGAMVYYGLPTSWSPEVEEHIMGEVRRQAEGK